MMRIDLKYILSLLVVSLLTASAFAESPDPEDSIWTRSRLTGDWGGLRSSLADNGLTFDLEYTPTYQGLLSGTGKDDFEYGGKLDAFLSLDSGKLGFWDGGGFHTHLEYRHGEANAFRGGALLPVNTTQLLPLLAPEQVEASSLYFTQKIGDYSSLLLGKINVVDLLAADPFFGGWGNRRFMNIAFVGPPDGVVSPTIFGAIGSIKTEPVAWTVMVFDPSDRTTDYFPDDLFSDGVNVSLSGAYTGTLAGRMTIYTVGATYSTKEGADLSEMQFTPELKTENKKGSYNIGFQFSHHLQESADRSGNGWGIFLKAAIADGNPNPIQGSVIGGLGGKALFLGRPQDSFGLGYFYYAFSKDLRNAVAPVVDFDDEQGLEAFYSYAVTPWLHVTGDIQYIDPASSSHDRTVIASLRTSIRF